MDAPPELLSTEADVRLAVGRARSAELVAVDIEANGRFAFRPRTCVVQLAWREGAEVRVALIDVLRVPIALLAGLFTAPAPVKIIHDVAFDTRLLLAEGICLRGVRDTHVAAQLCGLSALGLSALLRSELGIEIDKGLQQNDWSRRPLLEDERLYLAADVAHLPALDERLEERARALGITGEIADDSAFKIRDAEAPRRERRPAHARARGWDALDPAGRAVLKRLFELRDRAAQARDVPSGTLVPSDVLVEIARRRPMREESLPAARSLAHESTGIAPSEWIGAVKAGLADGEAPAAPPPPAARQDGRMIGARRRLGDIIASFRREEAARRGVSEQVVLPSRCLGEWIEAIVHGQADRTSLEAGLRSRMSLGPAREARYMDALVELAFQARTNLP